MIAGENTQAARVLGERFVDGELCAEVGDLEFAAVFAGDFVVPGGGGEIGGEVVFGGVERAEEFGVVGDVGEALGGEELEGCGWGCGWWRRKGGDRRWRRAAVAAGFQDQQRFLASLSSRDKRSAWEPFRSEEMAILVLAILVRVNFVGAILFVVLVMELPSWFRWIGAASGFGECADAVDDVFWNWGVHSPAPVALQNAGDIHAVVRAETEEILRGDDDGLGDAGEECADETPVCGIGGFADVGVDALEFSVVGLFEVFVPADDGLVVVGAGVGDAVFGEEVREVVGFVVAEGELEDAHAGEAVFVAE